MRYILITTTFMSLLFSENLTIKEDIKRLQSDKKKDEKTLKNSIESKILPKSKSKKTSLLDSMLDEREPTLTVTEKDKENMAPEDHGKSLLDEEEEKNRALKAEIERLRRQNIEMTESKHDREMKGEVILPDNIELPPNNKEGTSKKEDKREDIKTESVDKVSVEIEKSLNGRDQEREVEDEIDREIKGFGYKKVEKKERGPARTADDVAKDAIEAINGRDAEVEEEKAIDGKINSFTSHKEKKSNAKENGRKAEKIEMMQ